MQVVLENPSLARSLGVEPPTGLLLYGPPGTGKTTVARILAAQTKAKFLTVSVAEINQMWVGESEKAVQKLFAEARAHPPSDYLFRRSRRADSEPRRGGSPIQR